MSTKKHPKANLENYSKLFVQLGLVLSLVIVYALLQNKTFEKNSTVLSNVKLIDNYTAEQIIEFKIKKPKAQPIPKKVILIDIKKVDDNSGTDETFLKDMGIDDPVEEPKFIKIIDSDPISEDDGVPILFVEEAPLFPGCKGTKEEIRACFSKQITKHINRKFNTDLAEKLGLTSGTQRIFTVFKIDKKGNIVEIKARAPHKILREEAIRVIKLLPKMEPGKQQGTPVVVKYSLPIAFKVE